MEHPPIILLTTDGSAESLGALDPTLALAQRLHARVLLLTVVADQPTLPGNPMEPGPSWSPLDPEAQVAASGRRLAEIVASAGAKVPIEPVVLRGESVEAVIASVAAVRGVSFIAMASHARRGLPRLILGSVTESVVRRSSVPVIVFPVAA